MEEGRKKRENQVRFQGELIKNPRVFRGFDDTKGPIVNLFLKGDTKNGTVFIPVKVTGTTAERLAEKVENWRIGDDILVEGEIDWDVFEKDGKKQYTTKINAFQIWRIEGA